MDGIGTLLKSVPSRRACQVPGGVTARRRVIYMVPDDAGKTLLDIKGKDEGMWEGSPMGLATAVDVEKVAGDAKRAVNTESVRC